MLMSLSNQKNIHNRIIQELNAMETPQGWHEYKKEQLGSVLGKLDMSKSEKFAEYLNNRFMDAVMANNAVDMNLRWKNISDDEKIRFAQKIVNSLIELLNSDIQQNRVTLYNDNTGDVYQKSDDFIDMVYKQEIAEYLHNKLKITVQKSDYGLMGLSTTGNLGINLNWELYKGIELFLMDLRHEMMHMVDLFMPQISALDPQTRTIASRYYIDGKNGDFDLYQNNPLELNANLKRREFGLLCTERLANATYNHIKNAQQHQMSYAKVY